MRLVYLGTPEMAVPPLEGLAAAGHDIVLAVTGPDRRRGRGKAVSPSPVKAAATALGIPVSHTVTDVLEVDADLGVVVAFGYLIKPEVLNELEFVNLHFSLLPRWRGAAPVERAILAGDAETGVAVMKVEEGLDTGGIYAEARVPIGARTTAAELRAELVAVGTELLVATLAEPLGEPRPQVGEATMAAKFTADDFRIDWTAPPDEIDRLIRLGTAWTTFRGARIKILAADLDGGALTPTIVQPSGKAAMSYDDWLRGAQHEPGEWFE